MSDLCKPDTIETRLEHVERDLAILKSAIAKRIPSSNWIDSITGTFKDDADFEEIIRLGKALRDADRFEE